MIEARHLTKFFGQKKVVDDLSFTVARGEVLGFLGPNASGKTTTMRMITGFLPATGGSALVEGFDVAENPLAVRERIGYLPENAPVYPDMTVLGFLDFCAEIRGFTGHDKTARVEGTIGRCFLGDVRHQTVNTLSKGFKQRVCFAQSILHDPQALILDEPTDGLDPNQKHEVRTMIRDMGRNKAIILSTHILEEVDAVCTRAIVIARGRMVADHTPETLRAKSAVSGAVCVKLQGAQASTLVPDMETIPGVARVEVLEDHHSGVAIRLYPSAPAGPLADRVMRHLVQGPYRLEQFSVEKGRLDDVFRTLTTAGDHGGRGEGT